MFSTMAPIQGQTLDYIHRDRLTYDNTSTQSENGYLWDSQESGTMPHQQRSILNTADASSQSSSPRLQGAVHCYTRPISQPVQPTVLTGPSYSAYHRPYRSRASSTLPSPSPMTPTTEDMIDRWTRPRRPSDFATSAVSSFSPRSPLDYDFPTGNYLPPSMSGSQHPTARGGLFPEVLNEYQVGLYPDHEALTLDTKSSGMAMSGPPYPVRILEYHGDILPHPYLNPQMLNMETPGDTYTTPEDLLNMDYGAELEVPLPQGIPQNALAPVPDDEYVNMEDHGGACSVHHPQEQPEQALPLVTEIPSSGQSHNDAVHHQESSRQPLNRRPPNQGRSTVKAHNQCSSCSKHFETSTKLRKHIRKEHDRPYPCIFTNYGCNSVFGTKNEWSRHIKVQHLRLETWRCDLDECQKYFHDEDRLLLPSASKGKCEYDRKDLFLNHVRRCHKDQYPQPGNIEGQGATAYEDEVQQHCHLDLRTPPTQTFCPCCPGTSWTNFDARLEHIGRAMESNELDWTSFNDPLLEQYMRSEGLLQWREPNSWHLTGAEGKKGGRQARRGTQRPITTQAPLSTFENHVTPTVPPSRKSKRVAQKMNLRSRQAKDEDSEDAEADPDDDYDGDT